MRVAASHIVLVAGVCLAAMSGSAAAAPVQPWVHVQNGMFVDAAGQQVVLRGIDRAGGAGVVQNQVVLTLGANMVRLLVPWSAVETSAPVGGVHAYDQAYLSRVDTQIAWFESHGVNVLLDFHESMWSSYFGTPAGGIPAWYYTVTRAGQYTRDSVGMSQAEADWWTDPVGQQYYTSYVTMMINRYRSYPNVVGYELFNEPKTGLLGETHAATQAVIDWEAPVATAMRSADPSRAVFFMVRRGPDLGLLNADLTPFGSLANMVLDYHDYYTGDYGSGVTADDENFLPSWFATHNGNFLDYHGTEAALELNLEVAINRTRALGIPLFIGEWGVQTADTGASDFQRQILDLFDRYGLSWTRWDLGNSPQFAIQSSGGGLNVLGQSLQTALATPALTAEAPSADVAPSIHGFAQTGETLTVDPGLWAAVPAPTLGLQWLRCDASGSACTPITGATETTYTVQPADLGSTIGVQVTASNASGTVTTSAPVTATVTPFALTIAGPTALISANPANVAVTWTINEPASVSVVVHDAAGNLVKHLLSQSPMATGTWTKKWNETLSSGQTAPAGTYTATVTATAGSDTATGTVQFAIP